MGESGKLQKRIRFLTLLTIFAVIFLLTPVMALAQGSGTILGVVKDTTGAVVPNAKVTITNTGTSEARTATTAADGSYRVPALNPGTYDVKVEVPGFQTQTLTGMTLLVAQQLVANVTMRVGAATQQVTVTGEAPVVNTTTSSLGSVVNQARVADLPLNGRNYVDLTLLQPGVANMPYQKTGGFGSSGTWFSVNGAPARSNNYTLDGALMQNGLGASPSSEAGTTLGVDGIREYKVVTSAFDAEYGLVMGSETVMVSKSGTNQWHGDVFEYLRNSSLDARNFFDAPPSVIGRRLPQFRRNNFGGSVGGPIQKDKTFFFAGYEGLRQSLGVSVRDVVPPAACHNLNSDGTLVDPGGCDTTGTLTSSTVIPQQVQTFLDLYPSPNIGATGYSFPASATQREDWGQVRVDHTFNDTDSMFVRYTIDDGELDNPTSSNQAVSSGTAFPYLRTLGASRNQYLTISENHIFSPTLLNTLRLSGSRTNFLVHGVSSIDLTDASHSFLSGLAMGQVQIGGFTTVQGPSPGSAHTQSIITVSDDLFYTRGRHALKFGVLYNRFRLYNLESKLYNGTVYFSNLANFMQGIYNDYLALNPGSNLIRTWDWNTVGLYAQDQIRVTSRLTFNAGLRYEFITVPRERDGLESRFVNFANPANPDQPWSYGPPMRNPTLKNFQPRIGFAWDVFGNGKTAVRSGFGLYDEVANFGSAVDQIALAMPPYSRVNSVTSNPNNAVLSLPLQFVSTDPNYNCYTAQVPPLECTNRLQTMEYDAQQPYSLQYNLTIEQQLPTGIGLAVSYVGYRGIHLWQVREGNPIPPTDTVNGQPTWYPYLCDGVAQANNACSGTLAFNPAYQRINPAYGSVIRTGTWGDAWYNSLQVNVMKRLSHGLEFQSAYTWSKAIDTAQGQLYFSDCQSIGGLYPTAPYNMRAWDKGPACYDVRHNWHLNLLYHLPTISNSSSWASKVVNGWWVGNIVSVQSGFPFTLLLNSGRTNNGILAGQGTSGLTDRVNLGTDTTQATFTCSGTGSAFPGAPACSNGSVTYTYIPYDPNTVITGDPNMWFNPLMFRLAPAGQQGNEGRDNFRGPGLVNWDLSVNKDTRLSFLGEGGELEFRAEMFNVLNHASFALPGGFGGGQRIFTGGTSAPAGASQAPIHNVGKITTTETSSRQIQLALKIIF